MRQGCVSADKNRRRLEQPKQVASVYISQTASKPRFMALNSTSSHIPQICTSFEKQACLQDPEKK